MQAGHDLPGSSRATALFTAARAFGHDAERYAPHTRRRGIAYNRLTRAACRHVLTFGSEGIQPRKADFTTCISLILLHIRGTMTTSAALRCARIQ